MKRINYQSTRLACYVGYITQAITINLAPLFFVIFQDRYGVSYTLLGQIVLITFVIQILVDFLSIRLVDKIGYRVSAAIAHAFSAIGLILLGVLPPLFPDPYAGILIAVIFYSVGGGLTEVIISPLIDALPGDGKASSMSLLHSFYSWGQCLVVLITTIALSWVGTQNWVWLPIIWAIIPAVNFVFFLFVPIPPKQAQDTAENKITSLLKKPLFYFFILLMLCAGASEQAMSQWASLFAEKAIGVSKVVGDLLGPCCFAVLMGIGRVGYGIFGHKIPIVPALLGCSLLTLFCYLLSIFGGLPFLELIGCAFCGLGVSLMWPGVLSMSSSRYPLAGSPMFAVLALAGDLGCSVGPFLSGFVSDLVKQNSSVHLPWISGSIEQVSMKFGMLVSVIFPLFMVIALTIYLKKSKKESA